MHFPGPTSHRLIRPGFTLRCMVLAFVTSTRDLLRPSSLSERHKPPGWPLYPHPIRWPQSQPLALGSASLIIYSWDSYTSHSSQPGSGKAVLAEKRSPLLGCQCAGSAPPTGSKDPCLSFLGWLRQTTTLRVTDRYPGTGSEHQTVQPLGTRTWRRKPW